jgi:hypothetical protein
MVEIPVTRETTARRMDMSLFIFLSFLEDGIDSCSLLEDMFSGRLFVPTSGWC